MGFIATNGLAILENDNTLRLVDTRLEKSYIRPWLLNKTFAKWRRNDTS